MNPLNKSVAFVVTTLTYGGAEIQVSLLAKKLHDRGWKTSIITLTHPKALDEELRNYGVDVISLGMKGGTPDPRAIFTLRKQLKRIKPAIVHSHMIHSNLISRISRAFTNGVSKPPLICTAHSLQEGGKVMELLAYQLTDRFCNLTTNVSQAAVDRYVKVKNAPSNKIRKVFNGIETSQFQYDEEKRKAKRKELNLGDKFIWLAVGRLNEAKNFGLLLNSFKEYLTKAPNSELLIAGQGELEEFLKDIIAKESIENSVRMLGRRTDVLDLMCASDAYVMSSLWEGLPLVLLEAASVGLPIVTTDVGGNAEIVSDKNSGYIVPSSDQAALVAAMLKMYELPETDRQRLGETGSNYIKSQFDIESVVDTWESTYNEFISK